MKVLVVDDEPLARRRLVRMLARVVTVTDIAEAGDGASALGSAASWSPDVVLLDIHMPGLDGLEVARRLPPSVAVVFTTAYAEHALDAFDAAAVDYLVKPIDAAKLERALARVAGRRAAPPPAPRVVARGRDGVHVFAPEEIVRFQAVEKYTAFTVDGREHLVEQSLSSLEATLDGLIRVHRADVVRLDAITALVPDGDGFCVVLRDGQRVPVSRRHLGALKARLTGS